jgi:hypothetical protein
MVGSVEMLQRSVAVEVEASMVEPVGRRSAGVVPEFLPVAARA